MKEVSVFDREGNRIAYIEENDFGQIEGVVMRDLKVIVDGNEEFKGETND